MSGKRHNSLEATLPMKKQASDPPDPINLDLNSLDDAEDTGYETEDWIYQEEMNPDEQEAVVRGERDELLLIRSNLITNIENMRNRLEVIFDKLSPGLDNIIVKEVIRGMRPLIAGIKEQINEYNSGKLHSQRRLILQMLDHDRLRTLETPGSGGPGAGAMRALFPAISGYMKVDTDPLEDFFTENAATINLETKKRFNKILNSHKSLATGRKLSRFMPAAGSASPLPQDDPFTVLLQMMGLDADGPPAAGGGGDDRMQGGRTRRRNKRSKKNKKSKKIKRKSKSKRYRTSKNSRSKRRKN